MPLLENKVAVVTGAGNGIGRAVARALAEHGAKVVVNDYGVSLDGRGPTPLPAQRVVEEIRAAGGAAVPNVADVSTLAGGASVVEAALSAFGRLDVVVTCAGILRGRPIYDLTEDEWDDVIAVHLKGHYAVLRPATRVMREQRSGRIITVTSPAALNGSAQHPSYAAAKAGILGLTSSVALAMAPYGVTVNALAPSAVTRMVERVPDATSLRRPPEERGPEHIGPVAVFLASDAAAHLTGQIVHVAGRTITLYAHPRPLRQAYSAEDWQAERLAALWDQALGQDPLRGLSLPPPAE
jgi:NAD(P)-dependent dehydrogenase (short-subunit alcohol dehydrogenase family)